MTLVKRLRPPLFDTCGWAFALAAGVAAMTVVLRQSEARGAGQALFDVAYFSLGASAVGLLVAAGVPVLRRRLASVIQVAAASGAAYGVYHLGEITGSYDAAVLMLLAATYAAAAALSHRFRAPSKSRDAYSQLAAWATGATLLVMATCAGVLTGWPNFPAPSDSDDPLAQQLREIQSTSGFQDFLPAHMQISGSVAIYLWLGCLVAAGLLVPVAIATFVRVSRLGADGVHVGHTIATVFAGALLCSTLSGLAFASASAWTAGFLVGMLATLAGSLAWEYAIREGRVRRGVGMARWLLIVYLWAVGAFGAVVTISGGAVLAGCLALLVFWWLSWSLGLDALQKTSPRKAVAAQTVYLATTRRVRFLVSMFCRRRAAGAADLAGQLRSRQSSNVALYPVTPSDAGENEYMRAVHAAEAGDLDTAYTALRHSDKLGSAEAANDFGVLLADAGETRREAAAYRRADRRGSEHGAYNLGHLLLARGRRREARLAFARADERGSAEGATEQGRMLYRRGDYRGATAALTRGEARGDSAATEELGIVALARGDLSAAAAAFESAETKNSTTAAYQAGAMWLLLGDKVRAEAAFVRAMEAGNAAGAHELARLRNLRRDAAGARAADDRARELGWPGPFVSTERSPLLVGLEGFLRERRIL